MALFASSVASATWLKESSTSLYRSTISSFLTLSAFFGLEDLLPYFAEAETDPFPVNLILGLSPIFLPVLICATSTCPSIYLSSCETTSTVLVLPSSDIVSCVV
jgi:hypothetical protein